MGVTTDIWLWLALFTPYRRFILSLMEFTTIHQMPRYRAHRTPHGILKIKGYYPGIAGRGVSNQLPL